MGSCFSYETEKVVFPVDEYRTNYQYHHNDNDGGDDEVNLYCVTAIFNPCGYNSRTILYHEFANRMKQYENVKLYTIELVYGDNNFTVTERDNPFHFQYVTDVKNIWWSKENLINIAISKLPSCAKYICWIDADIEFMSNNWARQTIDLLGRQGKHVVQPFSAVQMLGPRNGSNEQVLSLELSCCQCISTNDFSQYGHPGMAWAMKKSHLFQLGGLYDMNPVGSGDLHFAKCLTNEIKKTIKSSMSDGYKSSVEIWGDRLKSIVGSTANERQMSVGCVEGIIKHHFHGNRSDRHYVDRWEILERYNYDPNTFFEPYINLGLSPHVAVTLKHWRKDVSKEFRDAIVGYFQSRKEDDQQLNTLSQSANDDFNKKNSSSNNNNNNNNNNNWNKKNDNDNDKLIDNHGDSQDIRKRKEEKNKNNQFGDDSNDVFNNDNNNNNDNVWLGDQFASSFPDY